MGAMGGGLPSASSSASLGPGNTLGRGSCLEAAAATAAAVPWAKTIGDIGNVGNIGETIGDISWTIGETAGNSS